MDILINPASDLPIYQQLFEQLSAEIVRGELPGGTCLPPIRTVAAELRISVITVKKAWEELERGGFIHTMAGKGCFVAELPAAARADRREELIGERLRKELAYYRSLGLSKGEYLAFAERLYDEAGEEPADPPR